MKSLIGDYKGQSDSSNWTVVTSDVSRSRSILLRNTHTDRKSVDRAFYVTSLKWIILTGTRRVLIEFLTLNILKNVKKDLYTRLDQELKSVPSGKTVDNQLLEQLHQKVLEDFNLLHNEIDYWLTLIYHYKIVKSIDVQQYKEELIEEAKLLAVQFNERFRKSFLNTFSSQEFIKFKLNIYSEKADLSSKHVLIETSGWQAHRSGLIQNSCCQVICPVLSTKEGSPEKTFFKKLITTGIKNLFLSD